MLRVFQVPILKLGCLLDHPSPGNPFVASKRTWATEKFFALWSKPTPLPPKARLLICCTLLLPRLAPCRSALRVLLDFAPNAPRGSERKKFWLLTRFSAMVIPVWNLGTSENSQINMRNAVKMRKKRTGLIAALKHREKSLSWPGLGLPIAARTRRSNANPTVTGSQPT